MSWHRIVASSDALLGAREWRFPRKIELKRKFCVYTVPYFSGTLPILSAKMLFGGHSHNTTFGLTHINCVGQKESGFNTSGLVKEAMFLRIRLCGPFHAARPFSHCSRYKLELATSKPPKRNNRYI